MSDKRPEEMTRARMDNIAADLRIRTWYPGDDGFGGEWLIDPKNVEALNALWKEAYELGRLNAGASTGLELQPVRRPEGFYAAAATMPGQPSTSYAVMGKRENIDNRRVEDYEEIIPNRCEKCGEICGLKHICAQSDQAAPGQPSGAREPRCPKCSGLVEFASGKIGFQVVLCVDCRAEYPADTLGQCAQFFSQPSSQPTPQPRKGDCIDCHIDEPCSKHDAQPTPDVEQVGMSLTTCLVLAAHRAFDEAMLHKEKVFRFTEADIAAILAPYLSGEGRRQEKCPVCGGIDRSKPGLLRYGLSDLLCGAGWHNKVCPGCHHSNAPHFAGCTNAVKVERAVFNPASVQQEQIVNRDLAQTVARELNKHGFLVPPKTGGDSVDTITVIRKALAANPPGAGEETERVALKGIVDFFRSNYEPDELADLFNPPSAKQFAELLSNAEAALTPQKEPK